MCASNPWTRRMILRLYTQDNCPFCTVMMENLANWGMAFEVINLSNNPHAKVWAKERGLKIVPALFIDDFYVNEGIDTKEFTEEKFYDRLDALIDEKTPEEIRHILENSNANS